ncbi:MAG: rod shape-determining protein MreC [Coriobacteriaceae bacterium]|jgi:rod shape-determining protein MreC|nr:MAG: rod shape-determining protein MreC [Coriobacteriaceae bacterium]
MNGGGLSSSGLHKDTQGNGSRLAVVLVVLSLVMFTMSARESNGGFFTGVRSVYSTITTPVRYVGVVVTAPFQGLGNIFSNLTANQKSLSELKSENAKLKASNVKLKEAEKTSERLEKLLALQSTYKLKSTAARVISGATSSWSDDVTIDKGSTSGLAVGMPVTDSNGAIGQIISCGGTSATVRLLTDENSRVSAMIQSSRAQGILEGSSDGTLKLTLISTDTSVKVGDNVVTSGLGGVFPKGLPIGTVMSVNKSAGALYYDIDVKPLSTTENFEEVLVITSLTEDQQATSEDITSADSQDSSSSSKSSSKSSDSSDSSSSSS